MPDMCLPYSVLQCLLCLSSRINPVRVPLFSLLCSLRAWEGAGKPRKVLPLICSAVHAHAAAFG